MADNISNIIDPSNFSDIDKLIDRIVALEGEVEKANNKTIQIQVDLKGAENLQALTDAVNKQQEAINNLNNVQKEQKATTEQLNTVNQTYGASMGEFVLKTANGSKEVRALTSQLQAAQNAHNILSQDMDKNGGAVAQLSTKIEVLKAQIDKLSPSLRLAGQGAQDTGKSFNFLGVSGEGVERMFGRMIIRMAAMQLLFTPLIAGVTALVNSFFAASKAATQLTEDLKKIDDARASSALQERVAADQLIAIAKNTKISMDERLEAVKELQNMYPFIFANLSKEKILAGDLANEYEKLDNALIAKANMEANEKKIQKYADIISDLQDQLDELNSSEKEALKTSANIGQGEGRFGNIPDKAQLDLAKATSLEQKEIQDKITAAKAEQEKYSKRAQEDAAKTGDLLSKTKEGKGTTKDLNDIALIQDMEREKQRLRQEADVQKQIVDDERSGLEERLNANVAYLGKLLAINAIELKMDKDKEDAKIENAERNQKKYAVGSHNFQVEQHIIDEANKKKLSLDEQYNYQAQVLAEKSKTEISKIYLSNENKFLTDQKEALTRQLTAIEDATLEQQAALKKRYDDGEINAKTYNKDLEKIQRASNDNIISTEISFLTTLLSSTDTIIQKHHDEIENRIRQLKKQQINAVKDKEQYTPEGAIPSLEAAVNASKEEPTDIKSQAQINIETLQKFAASAIEIYQNLYSSIKQMRDNEFAKEQMQIEIQQRQLQITSQQKLRAIDATTGFSIQKDNEKAKVAAETTAKENELQAKSNQLQLKKAKADKEAAEAGILMNTALAITKALVLLPTNPALAIGEIAIITAMGAAQYAAAASTPLPQFRYGTSATTTPLFVAGEAGEQEWIQTPDGKGEWSGTQAKVFHKPIGTSVTPISKIIDYAKNNVTSTAVENATFAIQLQLDKDKANYRYLVDQLAKKNEEGVEDIVAAIYNTKGNLSPIINVHTKNDLQF